MSLYFVNYIIYLYLKRNILIINYGYFRKYCIFNKFCSYFLFIYSQIFFTSFTSKPSSELTLSVSKSGMKFIDDGHCRTSCSKSGTARVSYVGSNSTSPNITVRWPVLLGEDRLGGSTGYDDRLLSCGPLVIWKKIKIHEIDFESNCKQTRRN